MKSRLGRRELVAMLMESPLYFELLVRERLELVRDHTRRWSRRLPLAGLTTRAGATPAHPIANAPTGDLPGGIAGHRQGRLVVGHFPPKKPVPA